MIYLNHGATFILDDLVIVFKLVGVVIQHGQHGNFEDLGEHDLLLPL